MLLPLKKFSLSNRAEKASLETRKKINSLNISLCKQARIRRRSVSSNFSIGQYRWLHSKADIALSKMNPVLDWGCGEGHFSIFLHELGFEDIHACAFSCPSLLTAYIQRESARRISFDLLDEKTGGKGLPYSSNAFSALFSVGVFEHVAEYGGSEDLIIKDIYRVLSPGGSFVCCHLPNKFSAIEFFARLIPGKYSHSRLFSVSEVKELMQRNGFSVHEVVRYGILPRNLFSAGLLKSLDNKYVATVFNLLDDLLGLLFGVFSQNIAFIAKKPSLEGVAE